MADTILLRYSAPTLPEDFCPTSWQDVADIPEGGVFRLDNTGYSFYNYGDTTPTPEFRTFPWLRTLLGKPDRWYVHYGSFWLARHPSESLSGERRIFVGPNDGSVTGVWTYDGGDGVDPGVTAPTESTGAMWEVDPLFAARFPFGAGTTANGTVIPVSGTGGADEVSLTADNLPEHTHDVKITRDNAIGSDVNESTKDAEGLAGTTVTWPSEVNVTADTPHNNLPPYFGVHFIKRTIRTFYTIPD